MAIDEARRHRHLFGVERLGLGPYQGSHVLAGADGDEAAVLDRKRLGPRCALIDRQDLGVEDDKVGLTLSCARQVRPIRLKKTANPSPRSAKETATACKRRHVFPPLEVKIALGRQPLQARCDFANPFWPAKQLTIETNALEPI